MKKIIHYCWFGRTPIADNLQKCIQTWRELMPNYDILRWDESTFDINSTPWTKSAYEAGKYAFVSDYVRLYALLNYGGIYLDTDVKLVKSLEQLQTSHPNTMGFENGDKLASAIIMAEPQNPIIKEFLDYYTQKLFTLDIVNNNDANVNMMTDIFVKYGLQRNNSEQDINGFHIYPRTFFCPLDFWHNKDFSSNTHCIHYFDASWLNEDTKNRIEHERSYVYRVKVGILRKVTIIRTLINKLLKK